MEACYGGGRGPEGVVASNMDVYLDSSSVDPEDIKN